MFGAESIRDNAYQGLRRVIDVLGDGPNNAGRPVLHPCDAVRRKLVLKIAALSLGCLIRAQIQNRPADDGLIGGKIQERNLRLSG